MGPMTRQDMQTMLDNSRARLLERMAQRQDVQQLTENVKTLLVTTQQMLQLLRQADSQRTQTNRRVAALEMHLAALEQEIRPLRSTMTQVASKQSNQRIEIIPSEEYQDRHHQPSVMHGFFRPLPR